MEGIETVRLDAAAARRHIPALAGLLRIVVRGGASVTFLEEPSQAEAEAYWAAVARRVEAGDWDLFAALRDGAPVGTVQLHPVPMSNQRHRGEIAKMMVDPAARRLGIGTALLAAAEARAAARGLTTLVLDTAQGDPAETMYRARGWREAGSIPDYALDPAGRMRATVIFYKLLGERS